MAELTKGRTSGLEAEYCEMLSIHFLRPRVTRPRREESQRIATIQDAMLRLEFPGQTPSLQG
jgi:hypothetical protein